MKKIFALVLFQLFAPFLPAQKINETLIWENKNIKIVMVCRDTASTDLTNWVKMVVRNKTQHEVTINDADFNLSREEPKTVKGKRAYYHWGNSGRKYELFDVPYEHRGRSQGIRIGPYGELASSEYIAKYEAHAHRTRETGSDICAYFRLKLIFHTNGVSEVLEGDYVKFCYYWKPDSQIDSARLAKRLINALMDPQLRQENTVEYLMKKPEILRQISSEELENALMARTTEVTLLVNTLIFKELTARQAIPNERLTEFYRQQLNNSKNGIPGYLINYWDYHLFDDVLASKLSIDQICAILDRHANSWSMEVNKREKVYDYLAQKMAFTKNLSARESYARWSNIVKRMSISRDKRIIDYLVPFLDNEETFLIEDPLSTRRLISSTPRDDKIETIRIRVCDVAFVSLLKAIGPTNYEGNTFFFDENLLENPDERRNNILWNGPHNYAPKLSERYIKLTPDSKQKIKNEIAARKNENIPIFTLIMLVALVQAGLYFLLDKTNKKYGIYIVFLFVLAAHIFVFPRFYYPQPVPGGGNCGMPLLGITLVFWVIGGGITVSIHGLYYLQKFLRKPNSKLRT